MYMQSISWSNEKTIFRVDTTFKTKKEKTKIKSNEGIEFGIEGPYFDSKVEYEVLHILTIGTEENEEINKYILTDEELSAFVTLLNKLRGPSYGPSPIMG